MVVEVCEPVGARPTDVPPFGAQVTRLAGRERPYNARTLVEDESVCPTDREDGGGHHAVARRGVLPSAVPSHPREQRVVGPRLHRVDERRQGAAAVQGPLSAAPAGGPRFLRSPQSGDTGTPGRTRTRAQHPWFLLLALLVQRQTNAGAPVHGGSRDRSAGLPLHAVLGERELDPHVGRGGRAQAARAGL